MVKTAVSFLLIFQFAFLAFAVPVAGQLVAAQVQTYDQLVRAIRQAQAASQKRTDEAVAQEKVREAWEIGKLIQEHILLNKERADYGKQIIRRLSEHLGINYTELKYMVEFARAYPIGPPAGQLSWSHHQVLLSINDSKERERLASEAFQNNWTRKKLRQEITRLKTKNPKALGTTSFEAPLVPIKGRLDTYRIVTAKVGPWKGKPALDLGFSNYLNGPSLKLDRFKEGDIVSIVGATLVGALPDGRAQGPPLHLQKSATPVDLFTYRAYPFKITDGDTLWVLVDLGFGVVTQQHLRLRGIDAPEIESAEGREAKAFLERRLRKGPLVIRTAKSDKYDRYLADLFVEDQYLNQELIDQGLAVRATD